MIKIVMMIKMAMMNGHYDYDDHDGYDDHGGYDDHDDYDDQMMAIMIIWWPWWSSPEEWRRAAHGPRSPARLPRVRIAFHLSLPTSLRLSLQWWWLYRVVFLTGPPDFQYQNEKQVAANQD